MIGDKISIFYENKKLENLPIICLGTKEDCQAVISNYGIDFDNNSDEFEEPLLKIVIYIQIY